MMVSGWKKALACLMIVVAVALGGCATTADPPPGDGDAQNPTDGTTDTRTEEQVIQELQAYYIEPLAQLFTDNPGMIAPVLEGIADGLPAEDEVLATVNGWPISLVEFAFREKSRAIVDLPVDLSISYNNLVEHKAILAQMLALNIWPEPQYIDQYIAEKKAEFLEHEDAAELVEIQAARFGITVDQYWDIYDPYYKFYDYCTAVVWGAMLEEAEAAGAGVQMVEEEEDYTDAANYYWQRRLEFKQGLNVVPVTENPQLQFTAILDRLIEGPRSLTQ